MKIVLLIPFLSFVLHNLQAQSPVTHVEQLMLQGKTALQQGNLRQATVLSMAALENCSPLDSALRIKALLFRAAVLQKEADHAAVIQTCTAAINLLEATPGADSLLVDANMQMAASCMRSSEYTKGIACIRKAIDIQTIRTGPNSTATAWLWFHYSELAWNSPDVKDVLTILNTASACNAAAPTPDPRLTGMIYLELAGMQANEGRYAQADSIYQLALQIHLDNPVDQQKYMGVVHYTIGERYELEGFELTGQAYRDIHAKAEYHARMSHSIRKAVLGPKSEFTLWPLSNLVGTLVAQGKSQDAICMADSFLHSVQYQPDAPGKCRYLWQSVGIMHDKLQALLQISREQPTPKVFEQAFEQINTVVVALDYLSSITERNDLKKQYVKVSATIYATISELLYLEGSPSALEKLWIISERSKSYLLNQAQVERNALAAAILPPDLVAREVSLRQQINLIERDMAQMRFNELPEDSILNSPFLQTAALYTPYDELKARLQQEYPDYFNLTLNKNVITVAETQRMLSSGQTLVSYALSDTSLYIFVLHQTDYRVFRYLRDAGLTKQINQLRTGLYDYFTMPQTDDLYQQCADRYVAAAYTLYRQLIAPVETFLTSNVVLVPDGILSYIPFDALLTQQPQYTTRFQSHAYLLRQYTMHYSYSATLLREMQQKTSISTDTISFLGVAPIFSGDTTLMKSRGITTDKKRFQITPLRYNIPEVESIRQIMGGEILTGNAATKQAFMQAAPRYKILHLATHGKSNDKIGDYSFLVFAETPDKRVENEWLYSKEIYNLTLHANLVVLSACETGLGEIRRGEGVISLARAFVYAGTKSIVTTLWSVDDLKSKEIMEQFYLQLQQGARKELALHQVKINYLLRHKGISAHPFFWAGYIAIGDMQPLR